MGTLNRKTINFNRADMPVVAPSVAVVGPEMRAVEAEDRAKVEQLQMLTVLISGLITQQMANQPGALGL